MAKAVWEEIQTSEVRARQLIEAARADNAAALRDARQKAAELIRQAQDQAQAAGEQLVRETTVKAEAAKEVRLTGTADQVQKLNAAGAARLSGAVKMIVEKVVS
jgi:vacuolar-type H+-ATPase subunit H